MQHWILNLLEKEGGNKIPPPLSIIPYKYFQMPRLIPRTEVATINFYIACSTDTCIFA